MGYAIATAACGIVADIAGFTDGISAASAERAAFWGFAAFVPPALAGNVAAWSLTSRPLQTR